MPKKTADSAAAREDADELGDLEFEAALEELETLVDQMETGEMTLEASLAAFERGVKLTRHCQSALRSAGLKVKKLTENNELVPLEREDSDAD